jgi:hypothetical protein
MQAQWTTKASGMQEEDDHPEQQEPPPHQQQEVQAAGPEAPAAPTVKAAELKKQCARWGSDLHWAGQGCAGDNQSSGTQKQVLTRKPAAHSLPAPGAGSVHAQTHQT